MRIDMGLIWPLPAAFENLSLFFRLGTFPELIRTSHAVIARIDPLAAQQFLPRKS